MICPFFANAAAFFLRKRVSRVVWRLGLRFGLGLRVALFSGSVFGGDGRGGFFGLGALLLLRRSSGLGGLLFLRRRQASGGLRRIIVAFPFFGRRKACRNGSLLRRF